MAPIQERRLDFEIHTFVIIPALAEDVTQDGFIGAFQNLAQFRGGSFRAWILKIVTNTSYDVTRRLRRHPTQPLFPQGQYGDEVEDSAWLADSGASI